MTQILHISIDDKFIESANWQFEQIYPGSNKFYIIVRNPEYELQYVKIHSNFEILPENTHTLKRILNEINGYSLVVLHGLDDFRCRIVLRSGRNVKFLWSFWGYEVYNFHPYFKKNIYGSSTKRRFRYLIKKSFKRRIADSYYDVVKKVKETYRFRAIKRIEYFGFPFEEEFTLLTKLKILNSRYIRFTYYPIEFIIKDHENAFINGQNILIGNSATKSNNHLEIFEILKKLPIKERKVIVPLSYGDSGYSNEILKLNLELLPENFEPLTKFYNLEEYNEIIKTCSVFIMNSYRQQGIGNIFAMLWMGARVYLDERNTTYQYLKRKNFSVFSISGDLTSTNKNVFEPLNRTEINTNREILKKELSTEFLKSELKSQIDSILNK